jgi:hypothetical protein
MFTSTYEYILVLKDSDSSYGVYIRIATILKPSKRQQTESTVFMRRNTLWVLGEITVL